MTDNLPDRRAKAVRGDYANDDNIRKRAGLFDYAVETGPQTQLFDLFDWPSDAAVLDIGCGNGLWRCPKRRTATLTQHTALTYVRSCPEQHRDSLPKVAPSTSPSLGCKAQGGYTCRPISRYTSKDTVGDTRWRTYTVEDASMHVRFECRQPNCAGVMDLTDGPSSTAADVGFGAGTVCHRVCPKCGTLHGYDRTTGYVGLLEGHEAEDLLARVHRPLSRSASSI
jgi:hypothetical protein